MISEKIKTQGELHKGYIVGMKRRSLFDYYAYIYFDGIVHIVVDDSFLDLCKSFDERYSIIDSNIVVDGIPVDVYVKDGNIYLDSDSFKREEK